MAPTSAKRVNSRAKGKRVELLACAYLTSLGFEARRGCQFKGTPDSPDVECPSLPRVHIEVKGDQSIDVDTLPLTRACEQSSREAGRRRWAVLWKPDRRGWRLTYPVEAPRVIVTVAGDGWIKDSLRWLNREGETVPCYACGRPTPLGNVTHDGKPWCGCVRGVPAHA